MITYLNGIRPAEDRKRHSFIYKPLCPPSLAREPTSDTPEAEASRWLKTEELRGRAGDLEPN